MYRRLHVAVAAACLVLAACGGKGPAEYRLSGVAMGTAFAITVVADERVDFDALQADIQAALDTADRQMSTWRDDSELAAFNRSASTDWMTVSAALCADIRTAIELGKQTGGAFDVTIGPLVNLWGFGPPGDIERPPPGDDIARALEETGLEHLHADCANDAIRKSLPTLTVDLSGYGKGRATDDVGKVLSEYGIVNFIVEVGGDLRVQGRNANEQPWRVAIEMPDSRDRGVQRIMQVRDTSVATSGDYRNYFEFQGRRYSHTIDPRTGRPVTHDAAAVTVVFGNPALADGYATAFLVLGPDEGGAVADSLGVPALFQVRDGESLVERYNRSFVVALERGDIQFVDP